MTPFFCKRSVLAFVALAGIVLVQVLCGRAVAAGETETLPDAPVFSTSSLGPVTLRYKFTPGMTTSLRMDLKLRIQMANLKETSIRFGMSAQYTVDSVDAAGRATATMVISELRGGGLYTEWHAHWYDGLVVCVTRPVATIRYVRNPDEDQDQPARRTAGLRRAASA